MTKPTKKTGQSTPHGGRRVARGLSSEERQLWDRVADTVSPEKRSKSALMQGVDFSAMQQALGEEPDTASAASQTPTDGRGRHPPHPENTARPPGRHQDVAQSIPTTPTRAALPIQPPKKPVTQAKNAALNPKTLRRVRSGRHAIEARLDLHGLRQHEAHSELRAFLFRCHAKGLRWALVITGKGVRRASFMSANEEPDTHTHWSDEFAGRSKPGILRERVPMWLSEPDVRNIVVGFSQAAPQHGGEGAIYVQLKAPTRSG
ncbi:MAG: Smr/MutS family protein [Pseudomonadota bacterium]